MRLTIGVQLSKRKFELLWLRRHFGNLSNQEVKYTGDGWLMQPFIRFNQWLTEKIELQAGMQFAYFSFTKASAIEPRLAVSYVINDRQRASLAYGLHSQLVAPQLYYDSSGINRNLDFTKAHHLVLSYTYEVTNHLRWRTELYYQDIFNVPVIPDTTSTFSALNMVESFRTSDEPLVNVGTGQNYGIETSVQRFLADDYFFLLNVSFYDSKYVGGDRRERNTRFNGNFMVNLTGGKEWSWNKESRAKRFGINARLSYLGGYRDTPIDVVASKDAGTTIYVESESYSLRQKDFF